MKLFKWFIPALFGLFLFTSCKKDKDQPTPAPSTIAGIYEGKYGTGSNTPSAFYSFNINADGIIQEINSNGTVVGTGTWTMTGNQFRASYHYLFPASSFFAVTGTYDVVTKKISGTWGYGSNDNDGGKWNMSKKQ